MKIIYSRYIMFFALLVFCGCFAQEKTGKETNKEMKDVVKYSDFGAKGNGKADDIEAIAKAHEYANEKGLPVKADDGAVYYIGRKDKKAIIQTDTDFGNAKFIIDDSNLENRRSPIFLVSSKLKPVEIKNLKSLKKNQQKIAVSLPEKCLVTVTDSNVKQYIRYGNNQNKGKSKTDVFIVDREGNIDMSAPVIWDFDNITNIKAIPIDSDKLTISGGIFTTIANSAESKYTYYNRGIIINRSNVEVKGLKHYIKGEGDHGAPYLGFLAIRSSAFVTVRDCFFTGHKTYRTIGSAGRPVSMGTYDIGASKSINVSFINCRQINDIKDGKYWGIMASNYCKNLVYDKCILSRFDAHMGVANATIKDSTIGHAGINAIGCGKLKIENTTVYGRSFVNMRQDYGSTWQGEFIFLNCTFVPACGRPVSSSLISGRNRGQHDFGYTCYMPSRITIENFKIEDEKHPEDYLGPAIFADFNPELKKLDDVEKFPIVRPKEVILKNVTTASGKELRLSDNPVMFRDVKVIK